MSEQYDMFESRKRRDAGIAKVDGKWTDIAIGYILEVIPKGMELDSQAIQRVIIRRGCPQPRHYNCWGAVFMKAKKRGILVEIGGSNNAARVASHARRILIYRRT